MTGDLFKRVLHLDRKFNMQKRKVLLLVSNCAAYPKMTGLKAITLAFFPPNTTAVLQPCDQGIIYNFKLKYRQRMVEYIIDCYDKKIVPAINVLMAARYAFSTWQEVSPDLILKCFRKSGFLLADEETMGEDDDIPLAQLIAEIHDNIPLARLRQAVHSEQDISVDELMSADSDLRVTEEQTDEDIISSMSGDETGEDLDDDDDVSTDVPHVVQQSQTISCISTLRAFFEVATGTDESVFRNILHLEKNVLQSNQTQRSILNFFKPVA